MTALITTNMPPTLGKQTESAVYVRHTGLCRCCGKFDMELQLNNVVHIQRNTQKRLS